MTTRHATRTARSTADSGPAYLPGDTTTTNLIGASAHQLAPTHSDEVVTQLNRAQRWITWWGWAAVACALVSFSTPLFLIPTAVTLAVALVGFARRRVVLHYEVDSDLAKWFNSLAAGWSSLAQTNGKWRVQTSTHLNKTHDRKMHAGARDLVSRYGLSFPMKPPMALHANVKVPAVKAKRHSLLFLPDRLLVKSGGRWSDVDYNHLKMTVGQSRFIEDGFVPRDGVQIDETWQYANVRGGPDRRFKNNRRLPVMLYSEVMLSSPQGLGWVVKLSRHEAATWWQQILRSRPRTPLLTSTQLPDAPTAPTPSAGPPPAATRSSAKENITISAQPARERTGSSPGVQAPGKSLDLVEIRLDGEKVGQFIPTTGAKVGPLVSHVECVGGLPVARASVTGNALKADVTVYVARAGDVPQSWIKNLRPLV